MRHRFAKRLLTGWLRRSPDPYWEAFVHRPLADPNNDLTAAIRGAPEGSIFPAKTEVTDPESMSRNLKELARWFGADLVGIARLEPTHLEAHRDETSGQGERGDTEPPEEVTGKYPFAVVCAIAAEYDPAQAQGIGGQHPVQNGALVTFNLSAYIRELGYQATLGGAKPLEVAVAAGLGKLDERGRFTAGKKHAHIHVADVILTDLPLVPDEPSD